MGQMGTGPGLMQRTCSKPIPIATGTGFTWVQVQVKAK